MSLKGFAGVAEHIGRYYKNYCFWLETSCYRRISYRNVDLCLVLARHIVCLVPTRDIFSPGIFVVRDIAVL